MLYHRTDLLVCELVRLSSLTAWIFLGVEWGNRNEPGKSADGIARDKNESSPKRHCIPKFLTSTFNRHELWPWYSKLRTSWLYQYSCTTVDTQRQRSWCTSASSQFSSRRFSPASCWRNSHLQISNASQWLTLNADHGSQYPYFARPFWTWRHQL